MQRLLFVTQGVLQAFVALGAVVFGILFVIAPDGRCIGASTALLAKTPFADFFIPGIILLSVNGFGQLLAAVSTFRRHAQAGVIGGIFGLGLMIWIFAQVNMIGGGDGLQYAYFCLGLCETVCAFFIDRHLRDAAANRG